MVTLSTWIYKGKIINNIGDMGEITPFGFIYEVTHTPSGKKYLGKKQLISVQKKALGKKDTTSEYAHKVTYTGENF